MPGSLRCRARRRRSPSAQIENLAAGVDTLLFETGYCPAGKPRRELTAKIQAVGMYQHIADLFGVVLPIGRQTPDSAGFEDACHRRHEVAGDQTAFMVSLLGPRIEIGRAHV